MTSAAAALPRPTIRPAETHELPLVVTLAHRIWPVCYRDILKPEEIENILQRIYTVENLQAEASNGYATFLAWSANAPTGFAVSCAEGPIAWLKRCYVAPEAQGRGLGSTLVAIALAAFPEAREARLLVNQRNLPAQEFYARTGWRRMGEMPVRMGDYPFMDYLYQKPFTGKKV